MEKTEITAKQVLDNVNRLLAELDDEENNSERHGRTTYGRWSPKKHNYSRKFIMDKVYAELSIFDWWNDYLTRSQLLDMKRFLQEAIKLGFNGYVCFKVGASGCANGMWAHKELSTTGYSPDGACLYRSFTPDYTYWSVSFDGKTWYPKSDEQHQGWDSIKTVKDLERYYF